MDYTHLYNETGRMKREWTLYIIEAENGFLYTGITKDLERRFSEHSKSKGAKFFRRSPPKKILYSVSRLTHSNALSYEYAIKRLSRAEKLGLTHLGSRLTELKRELKRLGCI